MYDILLRLIYGNNPIQWNDHFLLSIFSFVLLWLLLCVAYGCIFGVFKRWAER